jgi:hypothetical protein
MKKPKCKLCGSPHWTYEGHSFSGELRNQTPTVTESKDEIVTSSTVHVSPEKTEEDFQAGRWNYTHGGARTGSGRKRQHITNAERQKAYRERSR